MVNRIQKYLKEPESPYSGSSPKETAQANKHAQSNCAFCGKALGNSGFALWTIKTSAQPAAPICGLCIDRAATMSQFSKSFKIYYQDKPDYGPMVESMLRRLKGEEGSDLLKSAVIAVAIRMLQRASAKMSGEVFEKCSKTGVSLSGVPRMAIVAEEADLVPNLLSIVCKEIGLPFYFSTKPELESGKAFEKLTEICNNQTVWSELSIICCRSYCEPCANSPIVYVSRSEVGYEEGVEQIIVGANSAS